MVCQGMFIFIFLSVVTLRMVKQSLNLTSSYFDVKYHTVFNFEYFISDHVPSRILNIGQ